MKARARLANNQGRDLQRDTELVTGRLSGLGVALGGSETPEALEQMVEAIERFEDAVEARGGDLMVNEVPPDSRAQSDDRDFVLPRRAADETAVAYIERVRRATERVLARPGRS